MQPKTLKALAALMLLLAMAAIAGALYVSQQRVQIQGPSALAVMPDHSVWLSVDESLWHLDPDGARIATVQAPALARGGLHGLIGNLVLHPSGQLVASVRDDPTLYFLDPSLGTVTSRLVPQWPQALARHGSRAINYAFHGDGRVAIATGGGHTVALFDAQGGFIAQTPAGTYEFTNGLWWADGSLWTTNTNGLALLELDANTLAKKSRVQLTRAEHGFRYLGMALASHGKPATTATPGMTQGPSPLATVIRFANGMVVGHAVDVFPDGSQSSFPVNAAQEPRDIKWRGKELLLVDGASYAIKRYDDNRMAMADFGDASVRAELQALLAQREHLQVQYVSGLAAAMVLFVVGFAAAIRAQRLEKQQMLSTCSVDLSQVGTPHLSEAQLLKKLLRLYWAPLALLTVAGFLVPLLTANLAVLGGVRALVGLALKLGLAAVAVQLGIGAFRRSGSDPDQEGVVNFNAMQHLATDNAFWQMRHEGEVPREVLMLQTKTGSHWLVLTNERLLVFVTHLRERTLVAEHPRRSVVSARKLTPDEQSWWQRRSLASAVLRFDFKDGTIFQGRTHVVTVANRMMALLSRPAFDAPSSSEMAHALRSQSRRSARAPAAQTATVQVVSSLLAPGLGQWMQGRNRTALKYFFVWAIWLVFFGIPVVWTLWAPRASVSLVLVVALAAGMVLTSLLAAWDVWRMRLRWEP